MTAGHRIVNSAMKLVIIARHYPPAVSGGARRPYFLAHALKDLGVELFLVAPDRDPGIPGIAVRHPNRDPSPDAGAVPRSAAVKIRNFAREWVRWPDPDISWSRRAARAALAALPFTPDWVLTTSPPESIHWAGQHIKAATGARWCADFRDHWFERAFRKCRRKPFRRSLETLYARRLLRRADLTISINEFIDAEAGSLSGLPASRRAIIGHFAPPLPEPMRFQGEGPHLLHAGAFSLSDPDCSIEPTLLAFTRAWTHKNALKLHLIGRLSGQERALIQESPARESIHMHGIVSLETSLALQQSADALIVAAATNSAVPPGKYSEYLAVGRPIIAVGEGAWRETIGLADQDAVQAMLQAKRLAPPSAELKPHSARRAARCILDLLAAARPTD